MRGPAMAGCAPNVAAEVRSYDVHTGVKSVEVKNVLEQKFDRILQEYGPALSRLAYSYEREPAAREELLQEIALALWQALPHFRGECSERTFLYRIAHNRALSHTWKQPPAHDSLEELPGTIHPVDPRPHPEEQATDRSQKERLRSAIQQLPLAMRQLVTLMLEGFSHAEIGEVLGITENNVAVRLNRAKKALKDALGDKL